MGIVCNDKSVGLERDLVSYGKLTIKQSSLHIPFLGIPSLVLNFRLLM